MKIQLTCDGCGIVFQKEKNEYNRRIKRGSSRFFCTSACAGKVTGGWSKVRESLKENGNLYDISSHANNKVDLYTPFKPHFRRIKRRRHDHDITLQDLKDQWEVQLGKCAYSKVSLISDKLNRKHNISPVYLASLDRIDSTKGYLKGNIQWVSVSMNYAKNNMSHEQMLELCEMIKKS
jgi:glycerol-3-phosphate dehydrogenase